MNDSGSFFLNLWENFLEGIQNFIQVATEYWQPFLFYDGFEFSGLAVSLWLLVLSVSIGFILSLPLSVARVSKNKAISGPVWFFTYLFRGTPLYIQLLLIYSGLISLDVVNHTPILRSFFENAYNCLVLALTLNTMAYTIEIFAGYIRGMPHGEIEAAYAYGMSKFKVITRIVLPSALRKAIPAYSNEVILMLHATSLAFTATVPDILKVARDVINDTFLTFAAYGSAALIYMVVSFVLVALFRRLERHALAFLAHEKP